MDQPNQHITIEKLVAGGQGMGRVDNKVAFIWGALPGEEVDFAVIKSKKQFIEGVVTKITSAWVDLPCQKILKSTQMVLNMVTAIN